MIIIVKVHFYLKGVKKYFYPDVQFIKLCTLVFYRRERRDWKRDGERMTKRQRYRERKRETERGRHRERHTETERVTDI